MIYFGGYDLASRTYLVVWVFLMVLGILGSSALVYGAEPDQSTSISRIPYSFSSACILSDGTVTGIMGNSLVFVRGVEIYKSIPLVGSEGYVECYPANNPTQVIAYTKAGDVLIADSQGNVLYRTLVGFGTLDKAYYSGGVVYMLVNTPRGKELYAYDIDTRSWGYISTIDQNITNANRLLLGSVIDMVPNTNGITLLYDPILPPTVKDYTVIPLVIVDSKGKPVNDTEILIYFRDYDFSFQTHISGSGEIYVPLPISEMDIFVKFNETWYLYIFNSTNIKQTGLVITVPGKNMVPPPTGLARHYAVVIQGFTVTYVKPIGPASYIVSSTGSEIVVYDSTHSTLMFIDMVTGRSMGMGLDSPPISASLYNGILGVLTSSGTLYIFNIGSQKLLTTMSFPGGRFVGVSKDYVFVQTPNSVHTVSIKSLKDIFIYETAGLPVSSKYLYVSPYNTFMFSTSDSTLIVSGLQAEEPFPIKNYIPYKVNLTVMDPWGHKIGDARVFVDGVYAGRTSSHGTIEFSLNTGSHTILVVPPTDYSNVTQTQTILNVTGNTMRTIVLNRTIYQLSLLVRDPQSVLLKDPVILTVKSGNATILSETLRKSSAVTIWVKPGTYSVTLVDSELIPYYKNIAFTMNIGSDTINNITLEYMLYPLKLKVIDTSTGKSINSTIMVCTASGCSTNTTVYLPKGKHSLQVEPLVYYKGVKLYKKTSVTVNVPEDKVVTVKAERQYYIVNLVLLDDVTKQSIRSPVTIEVGGIKYKQVKNLSLVLPAGRNIVSISGNQLYNSIKKEIAVDKDGDINVTVPRKTKSIVIKVSSVIGNIKNGVLLIQSTSGIYKAMPVPPSGEVTLTLPIDWYTVKFESNLYSTETISFDLASENNVILLTKPTLKGLFILYSNLIFAGIGVIVALGILYWMSRKTVERVRSIKEISELLGEEYEEEEGEESEAGAEEEK